MIDLSGINMVNRLEQLGITFKRIGDKHWASCPFHGEKKASFMVNHFHGKDVFHCFGCRRHGDIIDFYRLFFGINTKEAMIKLSIQPTRQDYFIYDDDFNVGPIISMIQKWKMTIGIIQNGDESEVLEIYRKEKAKYKPLCRFAKYDFERRAYGQD